jgi:hypothetical protein
MSTSVAVNANLFGTDSDDEALSTTGDYEEAVPDTVEAIDGWHTVFVRKFLPAVLNDKEAYVLQQVPGN